MKFLCVIIMEAFSEKLNCKKVFLNFYAPKFRESVRTKQTEAPQQPWFHTQFVLWPVNQSQEPNAEPGVQTKSHLTFSGCFVWNSKGRTSAWRFSESVLLFHCSFVS